ncbi:MAG: Putative helicase [uncultured Sulfurovum sp.]|uniref:Helicase n=1 Tax=uncultured Sulfurovum sp. TaxID=269237 RepID=A0A6S6SCI8_9BACT|nr:MAG: Putative helicase [uncultured Sulfurovum sp.]
MSSSFFTNEEENTLKNRINSILKKDKNIEYLDFLIGYFRITGFDKISDNLNAIKHTRILVGINADRNSYDASQLIQKFAKEQVDIYHEEPLELKEYVNFESMKNLIVSKKIEIRISADKNVHSKMYLMRDGGALNHAQKEQEYQGRVIIGSSNLTHNGLEANTEINAELKDDKSLKDAVTVFEKLWKTSVELSEEDFDRDIFSKLKKPMEEEISKVLTPYELYIKLLIEHFGKRIDFIEDETIFVPKEYKKLSYQVEAVNDGIAKLAEHKGFFLSDVVGLGKTVVVAMLIKKLKATFKKRVLVVIPPAVRVQWEDTFKEFDIECCDIVSLAKLGGVKASKYELVVVDESHKFKNRESQRYKQLYEICLNKKVILLSATPQNNTPSDLYNQIALFQNVKNSTLSQCRNLQSFFDKKEQEYKKIINSENGIDELALKALSEAIRDKVIRTIMIRRTRYDIEHHDMYKVDIEEQGLSMPKVNEPTEHEYKLEGDLGTTFDETATKITQKLNYSRFNALSYLTKEARAKHYPKESPNIFEKNPLSGIMKTLLIKRFESSFSAFKISIARHEKRYKAFIENFDNDIIYLGEKATDILDYDEEQDGDYEAFIQRLIALKRVKKLKRSDFKKNFELDLKSDYNIFKELVKKWKKVNVDPKLEKFKEVLKDDKGKKIVIFTESVDTLKYLQKNLESEALAPNNTRLKPSLPSKTLFISSQNREEKKQVIKENFDANYKNQKSDYNIIVTTDTLAEGINLHRSNIIYNYDIPWNATKLIQRIGRVNRIGTQAKFIHIHNFKPASHIDKLIELSQKAFVKLQSSHTMMGEDNQIYTQNETVGSVNLFESYEQASSERDEELDYLEELRSFREAQPKVFQAIKELEQGLSLTREGSHHSAYVLLDINGHKNYVSVDEQGTKPISFMETAEVFRAKVDEVALKSPKEEIEERIKKAIAYFEKQEKEQKQDKAEGRVDDVVAQKAIAHLKGWLKQKLLDRKLFKSYREAIVNGTLGSISVSKINELYKHSDDEIKEKLLTIIRVKKVEEKLFDENLIIHPVLSTLFTQG